MEKGGSGMAPPSVGEGCGTRGLAVSEVLFYMDREQPTQRSSGMAPDDQHSTCNGSLVTRSTRVRGILSNGEHYDYRLEKGNGTLIGREVMMPDDDNSQLAEAASSKRWWTRAVLPPVTSGTAEERIVLTRTDGFSHTNWTVPAGALHAAMEKAM